MAVLMKTWTQQGLEINRGYMKPGQGGGGGEAMDWEGVSG